MILFFHGYRSSNKTNKYTAIQGEKVCYTVDYDALTPGMVSEFYDWLIETHQPDVLVGHSLGGYWALIKSKQHNIPCVLINPQLFPRFETYTPITTGTLESSASPVIAYIETGDEVIEVERTIELLQNRVDLEVSPGGHHRVENVEHINTLVDKTRLYLGIH